MINEKSIPLIDAYCVVFRAVEEVTATHGIVTKIDKAANTIAIKTADGTEHAFHWKIRRRHRAHVHPYRPRG